MIYGATGYTGQLASRYAKELGSNVVLAGRNEAKLKQLAVELDMPFCTFDVESLDVDISAHPELTAVLNCAGPFRHTAESLVKLCIKYRLHYLDVSAELESYQVLKSMEEEAMAANIMLLPGCGGSVAMLGCLTQHVLDCNTKSKPMSIDVALSVAGMMSRGSMLSAASGVMAECLLRRDGKLVAWELDKTPPEFDFQVGDGPVPCIPVTLPDLMTLPKSTGSSNIRTFVHIAGGSFPAPAEPLELWDGPSASERAASPYQAVAAVTFEDGTTKSAVLHSINGYTFTAQASIIAASKVVTGTARPGFRTPAEMFGSAFLGAIEGCSVIER